MPKLTDAERNEFLEELRYGILTMSREDGSPVSVPVWYEWEDGVVRMFAGDTTPKIRRLQTNPQASLLVINHLQEKEAWVAFDGPVTITDGAGIALAERLAARYWGAFDVHQQALLDAWRGAASHISLLELVPDEIRSYKD